MVTLGDTAEEDTARANWYLKFKEQKESAKRTLKVHLKKGTKAIALFSQKRKVTLSKKKLASSKDPRVFEGGWVAL